MGSRKSYVNSYIKCIRIRKNKVPNQPFACNVFCTKNKILFFFDHVSHVVIRAIPSVPDKNSSLIRVRDMSVYKLAKSKELIFFVCRLKNGIGIDPFIYVIKGINVYAVNEYFEKLKKEVVEPSAAMY